MTEKEAIEWQNAFRTTYNGFPKDVDEAIDIAIAALEKQIPKKVVKNGYKYTCPTCGANAKTDTGDSFIDFGFEFCDNCGQHIDWGEE
jgi:hypothetical protein